MLVGLMTLVCFAVHQVLQHRAHGLVHSKRNANGIGRSYKDFSFDRDQIGIRPLHPGEPTSLQQQPASDLSHPGSASRLQLQGIRQLFFTGAVNVTYSAVKWYGTQQTS
jgi:hypothetical protein